MEYNFREIEKKWQKRWVDNKTYQVTEDDTKQKFYVLNMFPYPSGAGLHVGHPLGYIASDIYARYKRLQGFNVLNPSNWPTPCNYYRQQYQPLSRTARQDRLLVRLEPRDTHLRPRILPLDAMGFPADVPELLRQQVAESTAHRPTGEGFRSQRHRRTGRGL